MIKKCLYVKYIFSALLFTLFLPGLTFATELPQLEGISPFSLAKNYDSQVDIQVTGVNTNFKLGQSTVAIIDSSGKIIDYAGPVKEVTGKTSLVFTLKEGLPTGTYQIKVTTGLESVSGGSLIVRGAPNISTSPNKLAVGYQASEITVNGVNTGFNEKTRVNIVDENGNILGKAGAPAIVSDNSLVFTLAQGLDEGNYIIKVKTDNEEAETGLVVLSPTATLKYNGSSFIGMPVGYFVDYNLTLKGDNTNFSGVTEVKLYRGSVDGADESTFLSNITVSNKETISFTIKKGLAVGEYYLVTNTEGQEIITIFSVIAPQISGLVFVSDLAHGNILPEGYRETKVELYGLNTAFNNNTTAAINGQTSFISGKTIESTSKISFILVPGLSSGSHKMVVDMDGNSLTTDDRASISFTVSKPSISQLVPGIIVNESSQPVFLKVIGINTHFTKGSPKVEIEGILAAQIFGVNVIDDSNLTFILRPNSIPATGSYDILVKTTSDSISEIARGNGLVTVMNRGISSVSPATAYLDELNAKVITITGLGTNFNASTEVYVAGKKINATVKSATEIAFVLPNSLNVGSHEVAVVVGDKSYYTNIDVARRSVSLSVDSKSSNYQPFTMVVTGHGVTFDNGSNKPLVNISGYGSVHIGAENISTNQFAFMFPPGLAVGTYQVTVSFPQGSYAQVGTLSAEITIESAVIELLFKKNQIVVSSLTVNENEPDFSLSVWGKERNGSYVNYTTQAIWSVISGSDVVSVTKGNISINKAGNAIIRASYGGVRADINLLVTSSGMPMGLAGNMGIPNGPTIEGANTVKFFDTDNHWAKDNIKRLVALGAVNGYADGTFKPNNNITRAEFAKILVGAIGLETDNNLKFSFNDSATIPDWAKPAVAAVVENGIVTGYEDNTFKPNNQITRAEIAIMIVRAMKLEVNKSAILGFKDADNIRSWAKGYVATAVQHGIINGYEDNTFKAINKASRAEAATMIVRMLDDVGK